MTKSDPRDIHARTDLLRFLLLLLAWLVVAATLFGVAAGCGAGLEDGVLEPTSTSSEPQSERSAPVAAQRRDDGGGGDALAGPDGDDAQTATSPVETDAAQEDCGSNAPGQDGACGSCETKAYQHCDSYEACASLGPNANCTAYTQARTSTFCAPYCASDDTCPTVPGFRAACNFAWCALLCEQGACPAGMVCLPDVKFIDRQALDRGLRDVCVIAP